MSAIEDRGGGERSCEACDREVLAHIEQQRFDQALAKLYFAYGSEIYRHCLFMLGPSGDLAQDALQLTFISAFEALPSFDPARPFRAWLRGIARHRCLDLLSRSHRRRRLAEHTELDEGADFPAAEFPSHNPLNQLLGKERWIEIVSCVQRLTLVYREAFVDHFESGLSLAELAAERGVSTEALRKRTARAIRKVAECLEQRGIEPLPARIVDGYRARPRPRRPQRSFESDPQVSALAGEPSYTRVAADISRIHSDYCDAPPLGCYEMIANRISRPPDER